MTRSENERFADIAAAVERCQDYRAHLDSPELAVMAYDAVLRNLAVIGEAVRALPDEVKQAHPDVPWTSIAGLRNIVVHEYFRIDADLVREILDEPLAVLGALAVRER